MKYKILLEKFKKEGKSFDQFCEENNLNANQSRKLWELLNNN